jgi:hypothetical protein
MSRILIGSYMVRYPLGGMMSYTLQWLVGLHDLGHDVYLLEKSRSARSCYDVEADAMTDDCSYGVRVVSALLGSLGLGDRWSYIDAAGTTYGLSRARVSELLQSADLFVDLGNHGAWLEDLGGPISVLVDGEPGSTQMKMARKMAGGRSLPAYDLYYTVGQNIGTDRATVDTNGITWRPVFYPVIMRLFPRTSLSPSARFTTVMNWQSHKPLEFEGRRYGQKDVEFEKFIDLPQRTRQPLEVAVAGNAVPVARLEAAGWQVRDAHRATVSFDTFRTYVAGSKGEFTVCKNVYVETRSGWFGDRAAVYLASGRPVVMQDTGFSAHLPCGEGLFAVNCVEEAADAIDRIGRDYERHSEAAGAVAREYLDAPTVLGRFLKEVGLPHRAGASRPFAPSSVASCATVAVPAAEGERRRAGVMHPEMHEHPAVRAWLQLDRAWAPVSAELLKKSKPKKALVYRLTGDRLRETPVIAKRCRLQSALKEQAVYERVLPQLGLPSLRCHGSVPDADPSYRWLFLEDAGDREIIADDIPVIADWLGRLHSLARDIDPVFPDHGLGHYAAQLATVHDELRTLAPAFAVTDDARKLIERLRRSFDVVSDRWAVVDDLWEGTPTALVHGDLVRKNVRMRHDGSVVSPCIFDWETAGYSSPGVDLVTCGRPAHEFPDARVLEPYASIVRSVWGLRDEDLTALVQLGMIFRCIRRAAVDGYSFTVGPRPWLIERVQANATQLELCLQELGWC